MHMKMATLQGINNRLEKYVSYLTLGIKEMEKLCDSFQDELKLGLRCHKSNPTTWDPEICSLKMLDSCVPKIVSRDQTGVYYALDFGGTYARAVRVWLKGDGKIETDSNSYSLGMCNDVPFPKGLMDASTPGYVLFDRFAKEIYNMMEKHGDLGKGTVVNVGFTFSFPCIQLSLSNSKLVEWTKEFETGRATDSPVEGQNVGSMLEEAFKRNNVGATVGAVINDTVGTLLSCAYQKPSNTSPCMIGLIIGTGSNSCYVEPNWKEYGYEGCIVNIEYGNFNRDLPMNEIDNEVNWNSSLKDRQLFEKLMSGSYLGEIVRRTIIRVFQAAAPAGSWIENSLQTEDAAAIINDTDPQMKAAASLLSKYWEEDLPLEYLTVIKKICRAVFDRSACLLACAVTGISKHINMVEEGLTCGIDGSLYVKNKWYREKVKETLGLLLHDKGKNINLVQADDGSGKGAALIAASS